MEKNDGNGGGRGARRERWDIRDVARHAKVSSATVSRTINGVATVNPELARRVWRSIEELNYFPNTQARALVSGRSRILGLIVSEITNPFFPELVQQFENVALQNGYDVLIASVNGDPQRMASCVRRMLERKVDGVAIMTFGVESPAVENLAQRGIPLVFMDAGLEYRQAHTLHVEYQTGIRQAVQHLAALGHRDIAFITGPLKLRSSSTRRDSFISAMHEIGVMRESLRIVEGTHSLDGGMEGMRKLAAQLPLPTAVLCSNDMTAIGVLHELYDMNLRVPADMSVIGFDNIQISGFTLPPLTTIEMSCLDIARSAVHGLQTAIETAAGQTSTIKFNESTIPTRLIIRQTTGFPRGTLATELARPKRG